MNDRKEIRIDKEREMRTKGISRMIDEGGLGADNYYEIIKEAAAKRSETKESSDA